jgi:hypothetical protein
MRVPRSPAIFPESKTWPWRHWLWSWVCIDRF